MPDGLQYPSGFCVAGFGSWQEVSSRSWWRNLSPLTNDLKVEAAAVDSMHTPISLRTTIAIVFLLLAIPSLRAQYGPKDGESLSSSDLDRVQVEQTAPDFTLPKPDGKALTLSSLRDKNVVLVFYRGHW